MTNLNGSLTPKPSLWSRTKHKLLDAIHAFSFTEKLVFYAFLGLFGGSAIFMLAKVNEHFTLEVPVAGGEITEGVVGFPRYINPLFSVTDTGKDLSLLVYSGLLKATPEGELVPDLAESYEVSDDGLTYTVVLKDNIYFHDGEPVTATDVEFTIKKSLDPVIKSPKAAHWAGVATEVVNEKTIRFTLRHPYGPFLENLTLGILPEHIWKNFDSESFAFSQSNFKPIGSGPYKVANVKQDKSGLPLYYELTPFKDYALGKPYINKLTIFFYSNEEKMIAAFNSGEIDQMSSISPQKAREMANRDDILIDRAPLPRIFGLFLNQNEAPLFALKEVRSALNESIDRQEIIDRVLYGFGTPTYGPLPAFISNEVEDNMTADEHIAEAQSILEKAGWTKNGEGHYEKKDKTKSIPLSFSISTSNTVELKAVAYTLKETWEKMGAQVEIKVFDMADLNQNIIRQRKYDSLLFGEAVGRDLDLYAFWHSGERNDPGLNVAMYTNSKVDKILDDTRKTDDRDKRLELYESLETEIGKDIPAIFVYSPDLIYVRKPSIKGVSLNGITNTSERFLGVHEWYLNTQKIWQIFNRKEN